MEGKGSLEEQLEAVKSKASEIATKKDTLRKVEELGANIEEALIFDNKYVYQSLLAWLAHRGLYMYGELLACRAVDKKNCGDAIWCDHNN